MSRKTLELERLRGVMGSRRWPLISTTTAGRIFMLPVIQRQTSSITIITTGTFTEIGKTAGRSFQRGGLHAGWHGPLRG